MKKLFSAKFLSLVSIFLGLSLGLLAQSTTFSFTGSVQAYTVPAGVTQLMVDASGAAGGAAYDCCSSQPNALGGRVQCVLAVTPGAVYYVYVGGKGMDWTTSVHTTGGYNGGGGGGSFAADAGGASDVRLSASGTAFTDRLVVAGGGGGGGDFDALGGAGGGLNGGSGATWPSGGTGACGGGQTGPACATGYVQGTLGNGGTSNAYSMGGGGGGWWGGNCGVNGDGGGGGGSSYTDPVLATSVVHTQGFASASGNGIVILTPICQATGSITGNMPLCPGDTNSLANPTGDTSGRWVSSNPSVATVDSLTGFVTAITTGFDTITFVLNNPCGGSAAQATAIVTVNPLPAAITGPGAVCVGATIAMADGGTGNWASSNGSVASVDPMTGIVTGVNAGVDTISYTLITGCTSATYAITVNALPVIDTVTGGGAYCAGGAGVHVGTNPTDVSASYQLYLAGTMTGAAVTGTGGAIDFGWQTAAGNYTVMATNIATGCTVGMAGSADVLITPVVIPTAMITSMAGDTLCAGTHTTFTAHYTHGGLAPTFNWMKNGANVGTDSANYSVTPANGDVIVVKVTSDTVCAIPDSAVATKLMTVLPNGTPLVTIAASPSNHVCTGTMVTVNATPVFGGYTPSYTWVLNTLNVSSAASYSYVPSNGDNLYCILNSDYQCRLANTAYSNVVDMTVDTPIVPYLTIAAHPGLYIAAGTPDTIVATVFNGGTAPVYQWFLNTSPVPAATSNTFIRSSFVNNDSVTCIVTRNDVCQMSSVNSVVFKVHPVGVQMVSVSGSSFTMVPNPNTGSFTIVGATGSANEAVEVSVTNLLGQVVYTNRFAAVNGQLNAKVEMDHSVADGVYLLNLHTSAGNGTLRFVVGK